MFSRLCLLHNFSFSIAVIYKIHVDNTQEILLATYIYGENREK